MSRQWKNLEKGKEEAESSEQKASDWVFDMASITWRDKLQHRDFIGEGGFNKWVSPFQVLVESKGWHLFYEHKALGFVDVVKEFYANMVGMKDKTVYVRGRWISFSREQINHTYNLQKRKNGSKFKRLVDALEYQKIVDLLTTEKGKWKGTKKTLY